MYRNGYQLTTLREALSELEEAIPGLNVSVDLTEKYETTMQGHMPTVQYTVGVGGRPSVSSHPMGVIVVPQGLAQGIRDALGQRQSDEIESLIDGIKNCAVT